MNPLRISAAAVALALTITPPASAQRGYRADTAALQKILIAEDMRGTGADGLGPLLRAVQGTDTLLRRVAVRGLGRMQRPELGRQIGALLHDPVPAVRIEAATAMAQSMVRVKRVPSDSGQPIVKWAASELMSVLAAEHDVIVAEAFAEALGRLPYGDTTSAQASQAAIVVHGGIGLGTTRGFYWLAANRQTTGGLSKGAIEQLKYTAYGRGDVTARRVAVYTLGVARNIDSAMVAAMMRDPDDQLRRLVLAGAAMLPAGYRATVVTAAFADPSPMVRVAAVSAARAGSQRPDCAQIVAATRDPDRYVAMAAADALGRPCADGAAAMAALVKLMGSLMPGRGGDSPIAAHALFAYSHLDSAKAQPVNMYASTIDRVEQVYAAKAAAVLHDTAVLLRLTANPDHNVREAAITGLSTLTKHASDNVYISQLNSPGYQVTLAAANALAGTQDPTALPALLDAFDRISHERKENAKDPRVAILKRISELGSAANAERLRPYVADFDTTIAASVAATLTKWTATEVVGHPVPLKIAPEPLAQIFLAKSLQLKVTMSAASGGGTYTIRLFNNEAPATVARIVKLARAHFYDGHIFQRVEPNFVVQGGGGDASEYVGDAQFMRDEVGARSHLRGTLGVSSRGRDTGDAQWFFNLIDNTRLDHEYTVFGEVVSGLNVVERIMEGDVIESVVVE